MPAAATVSRAARRHDDNDAEARVPRAGGGYRYATRRAFRALVGTPFRALQRYLVVRLDWSERLRRRFDRSDERVRIERILGERRKAVGILSAALALQNRLREKAAATTTTVDEGRVAVAADADEPPPPSFHDVMADELHVKVNDWIQAVERAVDRAKRAADGDGARIQSPPQNRSSSAASRLCPTTDPDPVAVARELEALLDEIGEDFPDLVREARERLERGLRRLRAFRLGQEGGLADLWAILVHPESRGAVRCAAVCMMLLHLLASVLSLLKALLRYLALAVATSFNWAVASLGLLVVLLFTLPETAVFVLVLPLALCFDAVPLAVRLKAYLFNIILRFRARVARFIEENSRA